MNRIFSEASRLIIQNWETVKEIQKAENDLGAQLREFLFSFESHLAECEWWGEKWQFVRHRDEQVYITHEDLQRGDDIGVWIGLERFTAEAIFGNGNPAQLYVWVRGNHPHIGAALRRSLENDTHIIGDICTRGNSAYIITHSLRKCLPEELEHFDDLISEPVLDFFSCYGEKLGAFAAVLAV